MLPAMLSAVDGYRTMSEERDSFLTTIVGKLEAANIPYMLAGSYGCVVYAEPRATNDIDIVVDPTHPQLVALIATLDAACYVSRTAANEALTNRSMFNIVDTTSGWKADLIIRKDRPFSIEEFSRRRRIEYEGKPLWIVSAEDAVLSKLEWAGKGDSERQLRDAASIVIVQWGALDLAYLRKWAEELNVADPLETIITDAERLNAAGDA